VAFANTDSITSTDMNNLLRGLIRDNTSNAHTGSTAETALASTSITGGTMGATGGILIFACGIISGTAGTKTIDLQFGSSTIETITHAAGTTSDWCFLALGVNTATNAQRWFMIRTVNDLITTSFNTDTTSIDTTANVTVRVTVTLGNAGDTVTQLMWDVFQVQIT